MPNVTISMDADTLAWVRIEAAKLGMSVSRWVGRALGEYRNIRPDPELRARQRAALERFLAHPGVDLGYDEVRLTKDEINDRDALRRFERDHPLDGYPHAGQAPSGARLAEVPSDQREHGTERAGTDRNLFGDVPPVGPRS
jgi:hypothetical protein